MHAQTQTLYGHAQDSILIRGVLLPDLSQNLTIEVEVHKSWTYPTSTQSKVIALKGALTSHQDRFGFDADQSIGAIVQSLDDFNELVMHGWRTEWHAKKEWSDAHRVLVLAATLNTGEDIRAVHQSHIPFIMAMGMFIATIETKGYRTLGLPEGAFTEISRHLNSFHATNMRRILQMAGGM